MIILDSHLITHLLSKLNYFTKIIISKIYYYDYDYNNYYNYYNFIDVMFIPPISSKFLQKA
jgi:hypothetical protein